MSVIIYHGDCREVLGTFRDGSVDCCVTSPPYWGLRDYDTPGQIGLEKTAEEHIDELVKVFREVRRVLDPRGTLWVNYGDVYNACGGGAGKNSGRSWASKRREAPKLQTGFGLRSKTRKRKDLLGLPWRLAIALQEDGWYLRSDVVWSKKSPAPDSAKDRPTRSHEYLFLFAKSEKYRYVRGPSERDWTVWHIASEPFKGAHFATFPKELVKRCLSRSCPPRGVVLDPFLGAGTTALVADRLGCDCVGIELNKEYAKMAARRIRNDCPMFVDLKLTSNPEGEAEERDAN